MPGLCQKWTHVWDKMTDDGKTFWEAIILALMTSTPQELGGFGLGIRVGMEIVGGGGGVISWYAIGYTVLVIHCGQFDVIVSIQCYHSDLDWYGFRYFLSLGKIPPEFYPISSLCPHCFQIRVLIRFVPEMSANCGQIEIYHPLADKDGIH